MPLVSVIMVAHRDTPYLRPAIRSVLEQTWRDLELILVDNGIGLTRGALGDLGEDERLRIIGLDRNKGLVVGFNTAVKAAVGEYVALLDSDDLALPRRIEQQVTAMKEHAEWGVLYMAAETIDRDDRVLGTEFTLRTSHEQKVFSAFDTPATTPTMMCRRVVLERFDYREVFDVAADFDFISRVTEHWETAALTSVGIRYRRYDEQVSRQNRDAQILSANLVRLLSSRRRAGRDEGFDEIMEEFRDWIAAPPRGEVQYAYFARRGLKEKLPLEAVYWARKSLQANLRSGAFFRAFRVLLMASLTHPSQILTLWRLFFTGPLRTFSLKPV